MNIPIGASEQAIAQGSTVVSVGAMDIQSGFTLVPEPKFADDFHSDIFLLRREILELRSDFDAFAREVSSELDELVVRIESRFWYNRAYSWLKSLFTRWKRG